MIYLQRILNEQKIEQKQNRIIQSTKDEVIIKKK